MKNKPFLKIKAVLDSPETIETTVEYDCKPPEKAGLLVSAVIHLCENEGEHGAEFAEMLLWGLLGELEKSYPGAASAAYWKHQGLDDLEIEGLDDLEIDLGELS